MATEDRGGALGPEDDGWPVWLHVGLIVLALLVPLAAVGNCQCQLRVQANSTSMDAGTEPDPEPVMPPLGD